MEQYERFVNDRMRADLQSTIERANRIREEIAEYETLRMTVDKLKVR